VVERLVHHGLFGELGRDLVDVGNEAYPSRLKNLDCARVSIRLKSTEGPTLLDGSVFLKMALDDVLDLAGRLDLADVQSPVHTVEGPDAAHVVAVVGVLGPAKDVARVVRQLVGRPRQAVEVLAVAALGAAAAGEEEADEGVVAAVGAGVARVLGEVDPGLGFLLCVVGVVLVAARPLVVPQIVRETCLPSVNV
jgi:hypothetical protein